MIEVMVTSVIAIIMISTLTQVMLSQQKVSLKQLEFIEAQQNARASIAVVKSLVRRAGWGMLPLADTQGVARIGACYLDASVDDQETACNNVDSGSDRLRVWWMTANTEGDVMHGDNTFTSPTAFDVTLNGTATHIMASGDHALISADCITPAGTSSLELVTVNQGGCAASMCSYTVATRITPSGGPGCATYSDGYAVSKADFVDFFIDRTTDPAHPTLRARLSLGTAVADAPIVAWDIDDFQVRYGIDTDGTPDGVVDEWCDDWPDAVCANGLGYSLTEKHSRILALEVAVVARTRASDSSRVVGGGSNLTVFDHTWIGVDDGYKRWIYRSTIQLRNNVL